MGETGGGHGRLLLGSATTETNRRSSNNGWAHLLRAEVEREIARSRRYGGAVTIARLEFPGLADTDIQDIRTHVNNVLRQWDTCFTEGSALYALLPETSAESAWMAARRVLGVASLKDADARVTVVTFPTDAPTVDGLFALLGLPMAKSNW